MDLSAHDSSVYTLLCLLLNISPQEFHLQSSNPDLKEENFGRAACVCVKVGGVQLTSDHCKHSQICSPRWFTCVFQMRSLLMWTPRYLIQLSITSHTHSHTLFCH